MPVLFHPDPACAEGSLNAKAGGAPPYRCPGKTSFPMTDKRKKLCFDGRESLGFIFEGLKNKKRMLKGSASGGIANP